MERNNAVRKTAYDAGTWVGVNVATPFFMGLMDQLEPVIVVRSQEIASASMPQLPPWIKRFLQ